MDRVSCEKYLKLKSLRETNGAKGSPRGTIFLNKNFLSCFVFTFCTQQLTEAQKLLFHSVWRKEKQKKLLQNHQIWKTKMSPPEKIRFLCSSSVDRLVINENTVRHWEKGWVKQCLKSLENPARNYSNCKIFYLCSTDLTDHFKNLEEL